MTFEVIEYQEMSLTPEERPESRPPRPWVWAIIGMLLGTFVGFITVADFEVTATQDSSLPPLTLPVEEAAAAAASTGPTQPRLVVTGFNQTLWLLVDADNPRLLRWSPHEPEPSPDIRPVSTLSVRPDASGAAYAEEVPLSTGKMLIVTRAPGDYTANYTVPLSLSATGWAWHTSLARRIAWSEPDGDGTLIKWTSFGPSTDELALEGEWRVVAYGERIIAQASESVMQVDTNGNEVTVQKDSIVLIDPDGEEFLVQRTVDSTPLSVQGIFAGLVYGTHGPDRTMVAVELALGNEDRVNWRHPDALSILEAPETGWGVLWFGKSVEIHGPQGTVYTHVATGEPHWSEDGQFLMFPDGDNVVVFHIISRRFGVLPTAQRVVGVWGS